MYNLVSSCSSNSISLIPTFTLSVPAALTSFPVLEPSRFKQTKDFSFCYSLNLELLSSRFLLCWSSLVNLDLLCQLFVTAISQSLSLPSPFLMFSMVLVIMKLFSLFIYLLILFPLSRMRLIGPVIFCVLFSTIPGI